MKSEIVSFKEYQNLAQISPIFIFSSDAKLLLQELLIGTLSPQTETYSWDKKLNINWPASFPKIIRRTFELAVSLNPFMTNVPILYPFIFGNRLSPFNSSLVLFVFSCSFLRNRFVLLQVLVAAKLKITLTTAFLLPLSFYVIYPNLNHLEGTQTTSVGTPHIFTPIVTTSDSTFFVKQICL